MISLDVERERTKRAVEAVFLLGKGADCRHGVIPFGLQGRAHRGLVGEPEATDGFAASPATAASAEDREARRFCCARKAALAAGENRCRRPVAAKNSRRTPCRCQDSPQTRPCGRVPHERDMTQSRTSSRAQRPDRPTPGRRSDTSKDEGSEGSAVAVVGASGMHRRIEYGRTTIRARPLFHVK